VGPTSTSPGFRQNPGITTRSAAQPLSKRPLTELVRRPTELASALVV
jgi:hypothetical protein